MCYLQIYLIVRFWQFVVLRFSCDRLILADGFVTCRVSWQNKFWIFDVASWLFYTKPVLSTELVTNKPRYFKRIFETTLQNKYASGVCCNRLLITLTFGGNFLPSRFLCKELIFKFAKLQSNKLFLGVWNLLSELKPRSRKIILIFPT